MGKQTLIALRKCNSLRNILHVVRFYSTRQRAPDNDCKFFKLEYRQIQLHNNKN